MDGLSRIEPLTAGLAIVGALVVVASQSIPRSHPFSGVVGLAASVALVSFSLPLALAVATVAVLVRLAPELVVGGGNTARSWGDIDAVLEGLVGLSAAAIGALLAWALIGAFLPPVDRTGSQLAAWSTRFVILAFAGIVALAIPAITDRVLGDGVDDPLVLAVRFFLRGVAFGWFMHFCALLLWGTFLPFCGEAGNC